MRRDNDRAAMWHWEEQKWMGAGNQAEVGQRGGGKGRHTRLLPQIPGIPGTKTPGDLERCRAGHNGNEWWVKAYEPPQNPPGSSQPMSWVYCRALWSNIDTAHCQPQRCYFENIISLTCQREDESLGPFLQGLGQFSLWPLQPARAPSIQSWTNGSWILIHSSGLSFLLHAGRPNYSILLFCLFTVYFIYLCAA